MDTLSDLETKARILIIGASGRVGSQLVKELDENSEGVIVRLSTSDPQRAQQWKNEGREAAVLDLNKPETFEEALKDVDRVFLLTGYTVDMLKQSKMLVDAASDMGVKHIVHLGVFTSRRDIIPHFIWHDMIEAYIEASGIAWTNLHPNVISDTTLVLDPPISETGSFSVFWGEGSQGWVFASDIAAVAAEVLRSGPKKHAGADYYLSTEVLTGPEVAQILSEASGKNIACNLYGPEEQKAFAEKIESVSVRSYMESATITMELAQSGRMEFQNVVRDDVMKVLGRPGLTMEEWARQNLK